MVMGFPNAPLPSGIEGGGIGVTRTTATGDPLSHGPLIMLAGGDTASITNL
jgi:hypothetical protein